MLWALAACPSPGGSTTAEDPSSGAGSSESSEPTTATGEEEPVTLHGAVQKGPFILGTSV